MEAKNAIRVGIGSVIFYALFWVGGTSVFAQNNNQDLYIYYDKTDSLICKKKQKEIIHYLFYIEKEIERKKIFLKESIFLPAGFREYILFIGYAKEKSIFCKKKQIKNLLNRKDITERKIDFRDYQNIYIIEEDKSGNYKKQKVYFEPSL